jgi:hypothetical protein
MHLDCLEASVVATAPSNKALKLTKPIQVRAPRHSAIPSRCSVPQRTFFINAGFAA